MLGKTGDAEAGAHAQGAKIDDARLFDLVEDLLRRQQRAVDIGRRQHDGELVAAQPRHGIDASQQPADARGDVLQHAIAGVMAQRIVDLLEAVEIQQQQRQRRVGARGGAQRLRETILQQQPIGQIGQRVVMGEIRQPALEAPALAPRARVEQLAFDRRGQGIQPVPQNVVARTDPHAGHRRFFSPGLRDEDERQVGVALTHEIEDRAGWKRRQGEIGNRDIPRLPIQRVGERGRIVDPLVHDVVAAVVERAHHERLVGRRVVNQQEPEQWCHNTQNENVRPRSTLGERAHGRGRRRFCGRTYY